MFAMRKVVFAGCAGLQTLHDTFDFGLRLIWNCHLRYLNETPRSLSASKERTDRNVCPTTKNKADRLSRSASSHKEFERCYFAAAAFTRAVSRDLYRAAAFLCSTPFCPARSMVEIVSGKISLACFASPSRALRRFLSEVLKRLRLPRLSLRRRSLCRILFSADL